MRTFPYSSLIGEFYENHGKVRKVRSPIIRPLTTTEIGAALASEIGKKE